MGKGEDFTFIYFKSLSKLLNLGAWTLELEVCAYNQEDVTQKAPKRPKSLPAANICFNQLWMIHLICKEDEIFDGGGKFNLFGVYLNI